MSMLARSVLGKARALSGASFQQLGTPAVAARLQVSNARYASTTTTTTKKEEPKPKAAEEPASTPAPPENNATDWSRSYFGLSVEPFSAQIADALQAPLEPRDIEIKPDGMIYLPEIKYRRIMNKAFGPGGWGLAPRTETNVGPKIVSREYALVCHGRLVAIARGEQEYFDPNGVPTATEACKSNALMRCCKDLGIASELWDPRFIREFKAKHCVEVFAEHLPTKKKKKLWRRTDQPKFGYPYQE
ncbi:mitochondrial genome maintenance MGM101 [Cylindrobasidium torrendii FP15055 ss-10]|uniref:Mitochondrial genome maintenance protein MGM101 n=1 Tax=Cylindrobasidium torrendii FP15055 ss-10 TaxID=1314674 RepID=A0A0D7B890_9AGAR|nr:mitochondrial genome maintenance MGM101 [Cylindrobasidium torrendii FP15055 ss-10]